MKRNGNSPAVWVIPTLVAAGLAGLVEPSFRAAFWKSRVVPLGMHDFGGVGGQGFSFLPVLFGDHLEYAFEFAQRFFASRY